MTANVYSLPIDSASDGVTLFLDARLPILLAQPVQKRTDQLLRGLLPSDVGHAFEENKFEDFRILSQHHN
jgi:hypothetical protein